MSTIEYTFQAPLVQQKTTVTVGGTITTETFNILIGGVVVATFTAASSTAAQVATGLAASWEAGLLIGPTQHPYSKYITATAVGSTVELLADVAGAPFTITLNTPGGSATFSQAATIANSGPQDASCVLNYSSGALPAASDAVIVKYGSTNICFGLEAITNTIIAFQTYDSYTGSIGLDPYAFCVNAEGTEYDLTAVEYRKCYLKIATTGTGSVIDLGLQGDQAEAGNVESKSGRIMLWTTTECTITIWKTFQNSIDVGRPAVRMLTQTAAATTNMHVIKARGGLGIATEKQGDVCTLGTIYTYADDLSSVFVGIGVTWTNFIMNGMTVDLQRVAGTATLLDVLGGFLRIRSGFSVTTVNVQGSNTNVVDNGAQTFTTFTLQGGTYDLTQGLESFVRIATTFKFMGGKLKANRKRFITSGVNVTTQFGLANDRQNYEVSLAA